jgi:hypothetical protein
VLELQRDGKAIARKAFAGRSASITWTTGKRGRYGVVVRRGDIVEVLSSPVYVNEPRTRLRVGLAGKIRRRGNRLIVPCQGSGTDVRTCTVTAPTSSDTVASIGEPLTGGRATITLRFSPDVRQRLRHGRLPLTLTVRDREGQRRRLMKMVKLK